MRETNVSTTFRTIFRNWNIFSELFFDLETHKNNHCAFSHIGVSLSPTFRWNRQPNFVCMEQKKKKYVFYSLTASTFVKSTHASEVQKQHKKIPSRYARYLHTLHDFISHTSSIHLCIHRNGIECCASVRGKARDHSEERTILDTHRQQQQQKYTRSNRWETHTQIAIPHAQNTIKIANRMKIIST